jgi:PAS domain S-box-containing protein
MRWLFPAAVLIPLLIGSLGVQLYEAFGTARAAIALTAVGTTITIGLVSAVAALWLRGLEDRLEVTNRALAATRQGVVIVDGTKPGRPIIYVNDAFTQITGYSAREALGRNADFLVKRDADGQAYTALQRCLESASHGTFTVASARRDGTVFSGRFSIGAVPGSNDTLNLVCLIEDVTAEQLAHVARLELLAEASQARKDAEAANHVKDVFFATITHELRSPLNACLMWLDVLALGPLSDKSAKAVDAIKRNLRIQTRLVNDLIDAAKISAGGIEIHREPTEMSVLLESNVATWQMMAAARQVEFCYDPHDEPFALHVDAERLMQVFNNLLENAFSNTPAGGKVTLRVRPEGDGMAMEVEDTGSGLSQEDLGRVFTPFWRASTTNREHKGLGLGLAIAEHLVKGHHGRLTARSAGVGRGCVFSVRLPFGAGEMYGSSADAAVLKAR